MERVGNALSDLLLVIKTAEADVGDHEEGEEDGHGDGAVAVFEFHGEGGVVEVVVRDCHVVVVGGVVVEEAAVGVIVIDSLEVEMAEGVHSVVTLLGSSVFCCVFANDWVRMK